jgi:hypothetical protein
LMQTGGGNGGATTPVEATDLYNFHVCRFLPGPERLFGRTGWEVMASVRAII